MKLIVVPNWRVTPAFGCWLMTIPIGTMLLLANSAFGVRSALVIAVAASACVRPTTLGTGVWFTPPPAPGAAMVTSVNCRRSMLRSVSTPSDAGTSAGTAGTCVTVSVPLALRMIA